MTYLGESGWKQREPVRDLLEWQRLGTTATSSKSPFYDQLFALCIADHDAGNSDIEALLARTPMSYDAAVGLRLFAGVQRCWLGGLVPELDDVWPQGSEPGDPQRTYEIMQRLFRDPPSLLLDWLTRDPQTNEVGRSAGLAFGLDEIAQTFSLPIRLFEIGSSGGLNLRLDQYAYCDSLGTGWGTPSAALRFDKDAYGEGVQFGAAAQIATRRGCDLHPIDATTESGALQLQSYVWPDQPARVQRLRDALEVARSFPVVIDETNAAPWVEQHVVPEAGYVTVLMHSIMWQYLPEAQQVAIRSLMEHRGASAQAGAPLAWLTLEPAPEMVRANVTVTTWPHGQARVVATSGFHGPPVTAVHSPP